MKQKVLVVDDDHLVADTLRMVFTVNGFESEACYSAEEGLERARSFGPALLLCDISMPGTNGLKLAAAIHREIPDCQMIMLTAYLSNAARVELEAVRLNRPLKMLSKPCSPELLLKVVEETLALSQLDKAS